MKSCLVLISLNQRAWIPAYYLPPPKSADFAKLVKTCPPIVVDLTNLALALLHVPSNNAERRLGSFIAAGRLLSYTFGQLRSSCWPNLEITKHFDCDFYEKYNLPYLSFSKYDSIQQCWNIYNVPILLDLWMFATVWNVPDRNWNIPSEYY